mmetsp:Transcript_123386/g.293194  ORF Transcript_123386/g.293194 Transcript_123386/m.293194 type:complete len:257 (+) Transcript_123386:1527-2297(+)
MRLHHHWLEPGLQILNRGVRQEPQQSRRFDDFRRVHLVAERFDCSFVSHGISNAAEDHALLRGKVRDHLVPDSQGDKLNLTRTSQVQREPRHGSAGFDSEQDLLIESIAGADNLHILTILIHNDGLSFHDERRALVCQPLPFLVRRVIQPRARVEVDQVAQALGGMFLHRPLDGHGSILIPFLGVIADGLKGIVFQLPPLIWILLDGLQKCRPRDLEREDKGLGSHGRRPLMLGTEDHHVSIGGAGLGGPSPILLH